MIDPKETKQSQLNIVSFSRKLASWKQKIPLDICINILVQLAVKEKPSNKTRCSGHSSWP